MRCVAWEVLWIRVLIHAAHVLPAVASHDEASDPCETTPEIVKTPTETYLGGCALKCPYCDGWFKNESGAYNVGGQRRRRRSGICDRRRRMPSWESMDNPCFNGGGPPMTSSSHSSLTAMEQEWVDIHNRYRCLHGAPPLTWNHDMANNAREYAILRITECFEQHQGPNHDCLLKHSQPSTRSNVAGYKVLGENIAALNGQEHDPGDPSMGVQMWYNEISFAADEYGRNPFFKPSTGHYTQMIFKSTREVGCSVFPDDTPEGKRHKIAKTIFICQYGPAQMDSGPDGQKLMEENILPRSVAPATCANPQRYAADVDCVPCGECNLATPADYLGGPSSLRRRRCMRPTTTTAPSGSFYVVEQRDSGSSNTFMWPNSANPKADYELEACATECKTKGSTYFMYGKSARSKDCGCVTPGEELKAGDGNTNWDIYKIVGESSSSSPTPTPTPSPTDFPVPSPTHIPTPSPTVIPTPPPTNMSSPSPRVPTDGTAVATTCRPSFAAVIFCVVLMVLPDFDPISSRSS